MQNPVSRSSPVRSCKSVCLKRSLCGTVLVLQQLHPLPLYLRTCGYAAVKSGSGSGSNSGSEPLSGLLQACSRRWHKTGRLVLKASGHSMTVSTVNGSVLAVGLCALCEIRLLLTLA